ncbi:hypothetical protein SPI_01112 [Niveomyces insectorum RCEF 264]|uniref:Uncharacterized protein n=1 Tax=Niveomyces insectorum RCEF 264 TaxID=1081102 RepID=A0A167YP71_9HYPO|nr:hypothetical protein SPI_01112 [Niveomyces insectorum RCEF 264]
MVAITIGRWFDHSLPPVYDDTLTLSVVDGGYLISGLTLAVTLAGTSFWNILAFFMHGWRVRGDRSLLLDLQHQVSLQNTSGAVGAVGDAVKTALAWRGRMRSRTLVGRALALAFPALVVWGGFSAAGVFVSRVANKSYHSTVARVRPDNCGFFLADTANFQAVMALNTKVLNDTIQARTYMTTNYVNTSASQTTATTRPLFVQPALPYTTNTAAACPIPASERCSLGHDGAFSMVTAPLDSQHMLGINAKPADRVTVQISVTCSPFDHTGLASEVQAGNLTLAQYNFGPVVNASNSTYLFNELTVKTGVTYLLESVYSLAKDPKNTLWEPIPELNRDDADLSMFFLSQNSVGYLEPVFDPFFLANGTRKQPVNNTNFPHQFLYLANNYVNTLVCADQYTACNPTTNTCTAPAGMHDFVQQATTANTPGFNPVQWATVSRIVAALLNANTYRSVFGLGAGALFANNLLSGVVSPAVPDAQWRAEVLGWFATSLAKLQAYTVAYAANGPDLGPFVYVQSPFGAVTNTTFDAAVHRAWQNQCSNQLVQVAGDVQNFSFLGVMIIACVSAFLILLSMVLGPLVDAITGWGWVARSCCGRRRNEAITARQTDDKYHLLRMALGDPVAPGNAWELRTWQVPVLRQGAEEFQRPANLTTPGGLASFPKPVRMPALAAAAGAAGPNGSRTEHELPRQFVVVVNGGPSRQEPPATGP